MANAVTNFLNGVANGTKSVILDPIVDIGSTAVKGIAGGTAALAGKDSKNIRENIDKFASQLKGEMQQPKQADSIAYAIGEGLPVGVDNAAGAVGLGMLAKQLPKAAQKGWTKILNKVKDAKSKKEQLALAKEAREYINNNMGISKTTQMLDSEAPAYQQRAAARMANEVGYWQPEDAVNGKAIKVKGTPEPYRGLYEPSPGESRNLTNLTDQFAKINANKYYNEETKNLAKNVAVNDALTNGDVSGMRRYVKEGIDTNKQIFPMEESFASRMGVSYGGKDMNRIKKVQKEIQDLAKMSDKDFKEMMQSNSSASWAGYGDWRYDLGEDWMNNWNKPKEYQRMKDQIIDNILNDAGLNYGVAETYGDAIKSNAVKSSKRYRNWLKKEARDNYRTRASDQYRAQQKELQDEATSLFAADDKERLMKQYGMTEKDYDTAMGSINDYYVYTDDKGRIISQPSGGWPVSTSLVSKNDIATSNIDKIMSNRGAVAKRHPTFEELVSGLGAQEELDRMAFEEAADIAKEAGPAYDSDRYLNWL